MDRRTMLAAAATPVALGVLDFSIRLWPWESRVWLLGLGLGTGIVTMMLLKKEERTTAIAVNGGAGLVVALLPSTIAFEWVVLAVVMWPASMALILLPQSRARPGSLLDLMAMAMRWLVPALISVLAGSLSVALCRAPTHSLMALNDHLEPHGFAVMLMACGIILAGLQIGRTLWGLKLEKRKSDLGHGLEEVVEHDKAGAYRQAKIVVDAVPRGHKTLVLHGIYAAVISFLCILAVLPLFLIPRVCVRTHLVVQRYEQETCPNECCMISPLKALLCPHEDRVCR